MSDTTLASYPLTIIDSQTWEVKADVLLDVWDKPGLTVEAVFEHITRESRPGIKRL